MSKQSDAKDSQGYTRNIKNCSNCANFTFDREPSAYNKNHIIQSNLRCGIGGFKVHKTATCNLHLELIASDAEKKQ